MWLVLLPPPSPRCPLRSPSIRRCSDPGCRSGSSSAGVWTVALVPTAVFALQRDRRCVDQLIKGANAERRRPSTAVQIARCDLVSTHFVSTTITGARSKPFSDEPEAVDVRVAADPPPNFGLARNTVTR